MAIYKRLADSAIEAARGDGNPLPAELRWALERAVGDDLAELRVHVDARADALCRGFGAVAFTSGVDVFFRRGAFHPELPAGLWLLGHEAAHVVQQRRGEFSPPSDQWERAADRCAARVVAGRSAPRQSWSRRAAALSGQFTPVVVQCHSSFEHRLLGDCPPDKLVTIAAKGARRNEILDEQIKLLDKWRTDPLKVSEKDINDLGLGIRTFRVGNVLLTYGELCALPDYLADGLTVETVPEQVLVSVLQNIRQEGYNHLRTLRGSPGSPAAYSHSPEGYRLLTLAAWVPGFSDDFAEVNEAWAVDVLTTGLGPAGRDHYLGLLARNACHFAPFCWYRWQAFHAMARVQAQRAHSDKDPATARQAWLYNGYAEHFLQDSFAAGHLINKQIVMQWFVEWAAKAEYFPDDWEAIKTMTVARQPHLAGHWLYEYPDLQAMRRRDPRPVSKFFPMGSNDPQQAMEYPSLEERIAVSGLTPDGPRTYQHYLAFLASAVAGAGVKALHDHYNINSVLVSSVAHPTPFEVLGDNTLLSGRDEGVSATATAARLSRESIRELIETGDTSIFEPTIFEHVPTKASLNGRDLVALETWATGTEQHRRCVEEVFQLALTSAKKKIIGVVAPRVGVLSQDQDLAVGWSTALDNYPPRTAHTLTVEGMLLAASNGVVYEVDPQTGSVLEKCDLTGRGHTIGFHEMHMATDRNYVFVGFHGKVIAVPLHGFAQEYIGEYDLGQGALLPTSVLVVAGRVFAANGGVVVELDPVTHRLRSKRTHPGGGVTRLDTDGTRLFVGLPNTVAGVNLADFDKAADFASHCWTYDLANQPGMASTRTSLCPFDGRLVAAANGHLVLLDAQTGTCKSATSTDSRGDTCVVGDGKRVFLGVGAAVHGFALAPDRWAFGNHWTAKLTTATSTLVSLCVRGSQLAAGAGGHFHLLDARTGATINQQRLTWGISAPWPDLQTTIYADAEHFYASVHGYLYQLHTASTHIVLNTYTKLEPDRVYRSRSGKARLVFTGGDLVVQDEIGRVRWSSATGGKGERCQIMPDGNLVVFAKGDHVWDSARAGNWNGEAHPDAYLAVQDDGDVTIRSPLRYGGCVPLWRSDTARTETVVKPGILRRGYAYRTESGKGCLVFEQDGHLTVYNEHGQVRFRSAQRGLSCTNIGSDLLLKKEDLGQGEVVWRASTSPLWNPAKPPPGASQYPNAQLVIREDGHVTIDSGEPDRSWLWSTHTLTNAHDRPSSGG